MKKLDRARLILRKEVKKKRKPEGSFLAIHLLNDAQVSVMFLICSCRSTKVGLIC